MPNLLLTCKCVRKCPYCFAEAYMADADPGFLQWADYVYVLDFYERNHIALVSLLGGEPSLHPEVTEIVDYALQRGFDVRMFTSGVMSGATRRKLQQLWSRRDAGQRINFVVNVNHPSDTPVPEQQRQAAFLEAAGPRASLSFNIHRPDFDLGFAFEHIARFGLQPHLRLGLAHRIARARNVNSHLSPDRYREAAANLARFFPHFERNRVAPGFDCGFTMCMFSEEQLGRLLRLGATFNWTCGPIVDIGPDLQLWPCFPLSHLRGKSLYEFDTLQQASDHLLAEVRARKRGNTGIHLECDICRLRDQRLCGGGCVSYMIPEQSS